MPLEADSGNSGSRENELNGFGEGEPEGRKRAEQQLDLYGVVEALLLVSPEPVSPGVLAEVIGVGVHQVRGVIDELSEFYRMRRGGLEIREVAGGFGFYARREAAPFIERAIRSQINPRLTRAALETLAIVAYMQPVSRGVIAEIRGVQSEGVIKTLEDRDLVQPVGRGGPPGYPALYGTTTRFLEKFGLKSLDDLPDLEQFAPDEETIQKIRMRLSWEIIEEGESAGSGKTREDSEDTGQLGVSIAQDGGSDDPGGKDHR